MINAVFRPLDPAEWPGKTTPHDRRKGTLHFSAKWPDTLDKLEKELRFLRAQNIVVQIQTTLDEIRNDGWPRSNARITGPLAAVSFGSKYGQLQYFCDDCHDWQHNIRCIALTLERLRMAEMYGVVRRGEQYQGFKRLPSGIPVGPASPDDMTLDDAVAFVVTVGGGDPSLIRSQAEYFQQSYRRAVMACHPDRHPALAAEFQKLQRAKDILSRHHNIR